MKKNILKGIGLRKNYIKTFFKNQMFKSFIKNSNISLQERQYIHLKQSRRLKKNVSRPKFRNSCLITKKTKLVYKVTKLGRNQFKNLVLNGLLPFCL